MLVLERPQIAANAPEADIDSSALQLVDLGFTHWETSWRRASFSNRYFDAYLARPRGLDCPFSFILKALKPEFCGDRAGVALVERERAIGSIDCRRLLSVADYAYPTRVSENQATRGYVVSPSFRGVTLAKLQEKERKFNRETRAELEEAFEELHAALSRYGWGARNVSPDRILLFFENRIPLGGRLLNVMLTDYSGFRRTFDPGLFVEPSETSAEASPIFDPEYRLPPETFYDPSLSTSKTKQAFLQLLNPDT